MTPIRLSPCTDGDLATLRDLSIATFREAFESQNDPEDFWQYLTTAFSKSRLQEELANPQMNFYFAWSGDCLAGYCKLNTHEAQTELKDPDGLEIERIYVAASFQGKGVGALMLREIEALAFQRGVRYLWLGVWQKNRGAIRFYQRHGYEIIGEHPYYIGSDRQTDWIMRRELGTTGPQNLNTQKTA